MRFRAHRAWGFAVLLPGLAQAPPAPRPAAPPTGAETIVWIREVLREHRGGELVVASRPHHYPGTWTFSLTELTHGPDGRAFALAFRHQFTPSNPKNTRGLRDAQEAYRYDLGGLRDAAFSLADTYVGFHPRALAGSDGYAPPVDGLNLSSGLVYIQLRARDEAGSPFQSTLCWLPQGRRDVAKRLVNALNHLASLHSPRSPEVRKDLF